MPKVMDMDRITKWKCLYCGSKLKRKVDVSKSDTGAPLSYSLCCCSCGHVANFAITQKGLIAIATSTQNIGTSTKTYCAAPPDKNFCQNRKDCKFYTGDKEDNKPVSDLKPAPKVITTPSVSINQTSLSTSTMESVFDKASPDSTANSPRVVWHD